jgi:zinc protease
MAGCYGPALRDLEDVRLISIATRVLTTRATAEIREKQQLAYSPGVSSRAGTEYPKLGLIAAASQTAPANARALLIAFNDLFAKFAKDGPTPEELETAKKQVAADLDTQLRQPGYWIQTLATLDYHGRTIDSILNAPEVYAAFTAEQVKAAWNKYDTPERSFRLWVTPALPDANQPPAGAPTGAAPAPSPAPPSSPPKK